MYVIMKISHICFTLDDSFAVVVSIAYAGKNTHTHISKFCEKLPCKHDKCVPVHCACSIWSTTTRIKGIRFTAYASYSLLFCYVLIEFRLFSLLSAPFHS